MTDTVQHVLVAVSGNIFISQLQNVMLYFWENAILPTQVKNWGKAIGSRVIPYSTTKLENKVLSAHENHCLWNSLPQDVMRASILDAFKRGVDKFLEEPSIIGYKPRWVCAPSLF